MDKKLLAHKKFVEGRLDELAKKSGKKTAQDVRDLLAYHDIMTRNFQHERAIHLAVTFFFAGLMIAAWVAFMISAQIVILTLGGGSRANPVTLPMGILALILTVLEIFYIRHYYQLENHTQKLYELTGRIYKLLA